MTEKINNSTDLEHFNKYKVEDLTIDKTKYEFSTFKKKRLVPFTFFSKKQFKNYINKQDNNTKLSIVGNIFINKKKYKEITKDYTELDKIHDKRYGLVETRLTNNYIEKHNLEYPFAKFDLFNAKDTGKNLFLKTIGYAEVEKNTYIRLVKHSVIPFIILLFLILILICTMYFPSIQNNFSNIDIAVGNPINSTTTPSAEQPPNVDLVTFPEITVLDENNKTIFLMNIDSNAGNYFISYELYIDGQPTGINTGAIEPSEQVEIDLWSNLNSGKYELKAIATCWDYKTKQPMPVKNTLITTLVVKK